MNSKSRFTVIPAPEAPEARFYVVQTDDDIITGSINGIGFRELMALRDAICDTLDRCGGL